MRYILREELRSSYSHDNSKQFQFQEEFDAESVGQAIVIARAMMQSLKIKTEKSGNSVEHLSGILLDAQDNGIWHCELVHERTETKVVAPEHFEETTPRSGNES